MTDPRRRDRPGRGDTSTDDVTPWPGWIRYTLLAVLVAVVGIGLVVALYDKGFLPIAGPFVVLFLLPLLLPLRQRGLRNRSRRLARRADERLGALGRAIELEQARSPHERASAATDESLASAGAHVDAARQQLGTGKEGAAADTVESLSREVTGRWQSRAALTKQVTRAASTSRRLQQVLHQAGR